MDDREVPASAESLRRFRTYHRLILDFAKEALGPIPIATLLELACECTAEGTGVERTKVLRYRPGADDLLVIAGRGWKPGIVGQRSLPSHRRSPPGLTYRGAMPTFIDDLPNNPEFDYSDLLREHGIVSLVNVPITVDDEVWGVLEVDSEQPRRFDDHDREFLCGFAEIIGRSIENRQQLERVRQTGLDQQIELREREALFRELQHRVGNQLQLIVGALGIASRRIADPASRKIVEELSERVVSVAHSHEQLSLARVEQDIDRPGGLLSAPAADVTGPRLDRVAALDRKRRRTDRHGRAARTDRQRTGHEQRQACVWSGGRSYNHHASRGRRDGRRRFARLRRRCGNEQPRRKRCRERVGPRLGDANRRQCRLVERRGPRHQRDGPLSTQGRVTTRRQRVSARRRNCAVQKLLNRS
jgi:two-component sensor histidine kinase